MTLVPESDFSGKIHLSGNNALTFGKKQIDYCVNIQPDYNGCEVELNLQ